MASLHLNHEPLLLVFEERASLFPLSFKAFIDVSFKVPVMLDDGDISLSDLSSEWFEINTAPASGAGEVLVTFNPSERLLRLLATARTGNRQSICTVDTPTHIASVAAGSGLSSM